MNDWNLSRVLQFSTMHNSLALELVCSQFALICMCLVFTLTSDIEWLKANTIFFRDQLQRTKPPVNCIKTCLFRLFQMCSSLFAKVHVQCFGLGLIDKINVELELYRKAFLFALNLCLVGHSIVIYFYWKSNNFHCIWVKMLAKTSETKCFEYLSN